MRNPLPAIVHCADSISYCLDDARARLDNNDIPDSLRDALMANASVASTILDCCKHQKRIIDDILTLSRLESTFLSLKPSASRPSELVQSTLAMFEVELQSKVISTEVVAEPSINELNIEQLNFDSSRVAQILINLLTNAIKLTKEGGERKIEVRYGATLVPPRSESNATPFPQAFHWAPHGKNAADTTDHAEWGKGGIVYLTFSLSDTGIGMTSDEIDKIFQRFRQANVMTHATYGGSGLGLSISKELTERMAGEIGVMSEPGKGSCFVIYIKTRRTEEKETNSFSLSLRPQVPATPPLLDPREPRVLLVRQISLLSMNTHSHTRYLDKL